MKRLYFIYYTIFITLYIIHKANFIEHQTIDKPRESNFENSREEFRRRRDDTLTAICVYTLHRHRPLYNNLTQRRNFLIAHRRPAPRRMYLSCPPPLSLSLSLLVLCVCMWIDFSERIAFGNIDAAISSGRALDNDCRRRTGFLCVYIIHAHIRRRDDISAILYAGAASLFYFSPNTIASLYPYTHSSRFRRLEANRFRYISDRDSTTFIFAIQISRYTRLWQLRFQP